MKSTRPRYLIIALLCLGAFAMASVASAAVSKVICVSWQGDPAKFHTAISGQTVQMKAVIKTTDTNHGRLNVRCRKREIHTVDRTGRQCRIVHGWTEGMADRVADYSIQYSFAVYSHELRPHQ